MSGKCRSAGPARLSSVTDRPTTTNPVAPVRRLSNRGSRRSAMFAFATAIAAFISFFVARAGITARTRRAASIANFAWRSRSLHRQVRRTPQSPTLSREPEQPHARRRLLRPRANHPAETRKDQTRHHPEPPLAAPRKPLNLTQPMSRSLH